MPSKAKLLEIIQIQSAIARQGMDLSDVINQVVLHSQRLTNSDGAAIELAEKNDMVYRAASGKAESFLGLRLARGTSISGLCITLKQSLNCRDTETDDRVNRQATRALGIRSMIVMPLYHDNIAVGVLKVMSDTPDHYNAEDTEVLNLLSDVIASAMYFARKLSDNDLHYLATHDCMCRLPNRSLFMDRLQRMTAQQRRQAEHYGVLMVDMNGLKSINDNHGHFAGDEAIKETAKRLKAATRATDTVARLGGDEFGVLISPLPDPLYIKTIVNRIHNYMQQEFNVKSQQPELSVSVGGAIGPIDATTPHDLLNIADKRMYANKQHHYNNDKE